MNRRIEQTKAISVGSLGGFHTIGQGYNNLVKGDRAVSDGFNQ